MPKLTVPGSICPGSQLAETSCASASTSSGSAGLQPGWANGRQRSVCECLATRTWPVSCRTDADHPFRNRSGRNAGCQRMGSPTSTERNTRGGLRISTRRGLPGRKNCQSPAPYPRGRRYRTVWRRPAGPPSAPRPALPAAYSSRSSGPAQGVASMAAYFA